MKPRSKLLGSLIPTTTEPSSLTHRLPTEWTTPGITDFLVSAVYLFDIIDMDARKIALMYFGGK